MAANDEEVSESLVQEDASIIQRQAQPQVLSHVPVQPALDTGHSEGKALRVVGWYSPVSDAP